MGKIIKFPNRGDKIESVKDKRTSQLKNNIFYSSLLVLFLFALVLNLILETQRPTVEIWRM